MPFSHHSHSGQFCGHANDSLEDVIQSAIAKGFQTWCLTEHIYRPEVDFYPEEKDDHTAESLKKLFDDYVEEAVRLEKKYADKINIMIGFESEWIRESTEDDIKTILNKYAGRFDFFMGSLHHVNTIPIDFDTDFYQAARKDAGGTDQNLFWKYFKDQEKMLHALRPPVVGHFDLIRLKSDVPNTEFEGMKEVWEMIQKNLLFINSYGGILELNTSGWRKGLDQPYPCKAICEYFLSIGGKFTISDDSHGISQVGTNYHRLLDYMKAIGLKEIWYADRQSLQLKDIRFKAGFSCVSVQKLEQLPFWETLS